MEHWITADLHLGHTNIITYSGRPFRDADEMNECIVERWNEVVAPNDRVLVLGDVAMRKIDQTLGVSARLHGYKVLLAGNHDRCAALHGRKVLRWDERYRREGGFAAIRQGTMHINLDAEHRRVLACHFPYRGGSLDVLWYSAERPTDTGEWLIHGHIHESWLQSGRQINVGIDAWGGRVASADEVVALIETGPRGPRELPRIVWSD
jgi:calcineurin-like phosphoesterase family protein